MSNLPGSPLYRIGGRFRLLETIERLGMTSAITRAREQAVQLLATRAPADARILDVACGSGPLLEGLAPALGADSLIVGVDEKSGASCTGGAPPHISAPQHSFVPCQLAVATG